MWIFTTSGFVSAVQNTDGKLAVRARDALSLVDLAKLSESKILRTPTADYPYRVIIEREQLRTWLNSQIDDLDYPNFKSEVAIERGDEFAHALYPVWDAMHKVEDEEAREGAH